MRAPSLVLPGGEQPLRPAALWLEERLNAVSSAGMTLPPGERALRCGDWLHLRRGNGGDAGLYRVRQCRRDAEGGQRLLLEHALAALGDQVLAGSRTRSGPLSDIVPALLGEQVGGRWTAGQIFPGDSLTFTYENENLLSALLRSCAAISGEWRLSWSFGAEPWHLHIERPPAAVQTELRLGRNLDSLRVTEDRSALCTRAIPVGRGGLTLSAIEADTLAEYGAVTAVIAAPLVDDSATLRALAAAALQRRCRPALCVSAVARDLSPETGEPLDALAPGVVCRIPLPREGLTLTERVTCLRWPDLVGDPARAELTLGAEGERASRMLGLRA